MIFAQVMDTITIFDRYGVAIGMLVVFIAASIYLGRFVFGPKGLLVYYISKTVDTMEGIGRTCEQQAATQSNVADNQTKMIELMETSGKRLKNLEEGQQRLEQMMRVVVDGLKMELKEHEKNV